MEDDMKEEVVFSNDPADYNRVQCMACTAYNTVKIHHMRKHLDSHKMDMETYKFKYGSEWEYVRKVYHKCGICEASMLFDLETLFNHLKGNHQIKVKEYIELYIGPLDQLKQQINNTSSSSTIKQEQPKPKVKQERTSPSSKKFSGPASVKKKLLGPASVRKERIATPSPPPKKRKGRNVPIEDDEDFYASLKPTKTGRISDISTFNTGPLERIQEWADDGCLISNDIADYTCVECQVCGQHLPMTRLRSHTKSAHKMTITEYKAQYGADLEPVEVVWHRCGVCGDLVMLDSDHIAVHLKRGGHPVITHKDYNDQYMVDTRRGKEVVAREKPRLPSVDADGAPRKVVKKEEKVVVKREERSRRSRDQENNRKNIWETNQNYISGGSESEEEEEKPSTSKQHVRKNGKKALPLDEDSDKDKESVDEKVEETQGASDNGVKSIQLGEGEKKLDVIMLFE